MNFQLRIQVLQQGSYVVPQQLKYCVASLNVQRLLNKLLLTITHVVNGMETSI